MSDSTSAQIAKGQEASTVVPLWSDVVLDDAAIKTQRLALLAELTSEQYATGLRSGARPSRSELAAARHLARGAQLAREAAEQRRGRCLAMYGRPPAGVRS